MNHFFQSRNSLKNQLTKGIGIVFAACIINLSACKEKEEPLPEGFNKVASFELIPFDSVFTIWPGDQELNLSPKFTAAFGEEVILPSIPSIQFYIDGKRSSNPPRIPTDKEREFEIFAKIGKLTSKPVKIRVIDVDPKTYVSRFKASMGDSTKAPYAISGRSFVDFKASIYDYRGKEFEESNKPPYKFYFDGVQLEKLHRVPIFRSGEIPFWVEVGGKKSEIEILISRELPNFPKKYSLPIVFHVVHSGQEKGTRENPGQENFVQLLKETNDWLLGKSESEFRKGHNQVDPNIEFYLAPNGQDEKPLEEPGINRIFSEKLSYPIGEEITRKYVFDQMWNPNEYVNVFVMNIDGRDGFSSYPPGSGSNMPLSRFYGFVINKGFQNFLMLHELGHFLGLPHTFSNGNQCIDGDGFQDTESYNDDLKKTFLQLKTNCEGEFFFATNIMDYYPTVGNSFTLDQVSKMRSTLEKAHFLPIAPHPNERIKTQAWRGKFDPTIKPIE
ncbi:M43 family zinc metalloprotease [Algoriphagus litoralis]|uniref:M43 family zinc metalloprotease n=1 Tax=Algoriphagus litoralis TaxID=2202829 RepID=UPI000DB9D363|nr:M43 family zinc metalloprotease [Algoriphagus litoralis]